MRSLLFYNKFILNVYYFLFYDMVCWCKIFAILPCTTYTAFLNICYYYEWVLFAPNLLTIESFTIIMNVYMCVYVCISECACVYVCVCAFLRVYVCVSEKASSHRATYSCHSRVILHPQTGLRSATFHPETGNISPVSNSTCKLIIHSPGVWH